MGKYISGKVLAYKKKTSQGYNSGTIKQSAYDNEKRKKDNKRRNKSNPPSNPTPPSRLSHRQDHQMSSLEARNKINLHSTEEQQWHSVPVNQDIKKSRLVQDTKERLVRKTAWQWFHGQVQL